jgi:hypothetical protein
MQGKTLTVIAAGQTAGAGAFAIIAANILNAYVGGFITHARVSYLAVGARVIGNVNHIYIGTVAIPTQLLMAFDEINTEVGAPVGEATYYAGETAPGIAIAPTELHIWAMSTLYAPVRLQITMTIWPP